MSRAYQGQVDGAIPAHAAQGGDARYVGHSLAPQGAILKTGGPDWVDAPRACSGLIKSTNAPCPVAPVEGEQFCIGHARAQAKAEREGKRVVRES